MARAVHDTSAILDCAARMLGPDRSDAITVAGVIREAGVSSGSVYHRFPTRAALLAALWNRAVERYHGAVDPLFDGAPVDAAAAIGRRTVTWSLANPADARVLQAGIEAFDPGAWPDDERARQRAEQQRWDREVTRLIKALRSTTGHETAALLLIVVDVPYAAVRRYLAVDTPVPRGLGATVERLIRATLSAPADAGPQG
jgi:AcrR family transcriptional regulator